MKIIYSNYGDTATMTASPAVVSTMPVTRLQDQTRGATRTTSTADQDIKLTWSTSKLFSACVLVRHNLSSNATWRVRIYSDAAWTTLVYDSGAVVANPAKALGDLEWGIDPLGASIFTGWSYAFSSMYFTPVAGRSVKITLSDAANTDGYLQASRLFLGPHIQPATGPSYGLRNGWKNNTQNTRTDGGSLRSDPTAAFRTMSFGLDWISDADRARFLEMARLIGRDKDFWVTVFPGEGGQHERDYSMVGKFVNMPDFTTPFYNNYAAPFELEEA